MDAAGPVSLHAGTLERFAAELFIAAGLTDAMAAEWSKALVWANRRGVDSHGVLRIPRYVELLRKGAINRSPHMHVTRSKAAVQILEADRAPGPIAMAEAMNHAISASLTYGIGWCGARNITHAGAIGQIANRAAEAGLAGIVITASGPLMAYHGSRASGVSTNPLSIAFPRSNGAPLLLDMSTSTVALGKVMNAKDSGQPIPLGWAIDGHGRGTTNAAEVATLTPLGGPKGSGLSLMIECLTSIAMANPIISPALRSSGAEDNPTLNGAAVALDLAAFGDADAILREADALAEAVLSLPRAEGVDQLYLPGGRGEAARREREKSGIPIPSGTWKRIAVTARALGVALPTGVNG